MQHPEVTLLPTFQSKDLAYFTPSIVNLLFTERTNFDECEILKSFNWQQRQTERIVILMLFILEFKSEMKKILSHFSFLFCLFSVDYESYKSLKKISWMYKHPKLTFTPAMLSTNWYIPWLCVLSAHFPCYGHKLVAVFRNLFRVIFISISIGCLWSGNGSLLLVQFETIKLSVFGVGWTQDSYQT